jgi:perosamine synthetase
MALKYRYPNIKKIYVPDNVYVAVWNSVLYEYPIECLEVMKMNDSTLNIDTSEEYIKTLEAASAVLITHNVGNVVNVPRLKRLRPDLVFIEDACEAFGGSYEGMPVGSASLCASMSFFANKTLTGGELGAILTDDSDLYSYLGKKINQGNSEKRYVHEMLAYNYRATNLTAGLLCDQLADMPEILNRKKRVFDAYEKHFPRTIETDTVPSNWIMPIRIPGNLSYEQAEDFFRDKAIDIRPMFYEVSVHAHLGSITPSEVGNKIHRETIMVPSHPMLTDREVEYIVSTIKDYQRLV